MTTAEAVRARVGVRAWFLGQVAAVAAALSAGVAPTASAASFRVESGEVRVSVPLRPGGAFEARSSALGGRLRAEGSKPVVLSGDITLDLKAIDTGIELRNRHLRENYLEVAKGAGYDKAVLSEVRVSEADGEPFRGRSAFTATLLLHGVKATVGGSAEIRDAGTAGAVRVVASFPLTLTDFGIQPPEYMGVGVGNKVLVRVMLSAVPAGGGAQ